MLVEGRNLSQDVPDTPLPQYVGEEHTFRNNNMINVRIEEEWDVDRSNNTAQISRCYHLHPLSNLEVEEENCQHVTEVNEVWIDNVLLDTFYKREDKVL